ncbi:hypothetical protein Pcinc_038300, partial [Petrolisthes cinctipes]
MWVQDGFTDGQAGHGVKPRPSVYSDGSRFQEVGSGPVYRLEIPNCRLEDTGAYSILASNEHGETPSCRITSKSTLK